MHNLKRNFDKFYSIAKSFFPLANPDGNFQYYRRNPKMSDIEIIALALSSEAIGIDSENYLFGKLTIDYFCDFPNLPDRSNYNRRRRRLAAHIESLNRKIAALLSQDEDVFIVDSIPVPVCKIVREKSSRVCKEHFETAPDKGYSAVNKSYIFGYKLHMVTSLKGVYYSMDLTKASVHDIHYLQDLKGRGLTDCTLIGDRGYLSATVKTDLFHECQIDLQVPMRNNQNEKTVFPKVFRKSRKRIETLFSQLCDQFMLKRNYAKSFIGLCTRIISKITAVICLQLMNLDAKKPINHLKFALT